MSLRLSFPIRSHFLKLRARCPGKSVFKKYGLLCVGLLCFHSVHAQNIDYVDAVFSVELNNKLTQGENRLKIRRDHNRYAIQFELDHWLSSASQKATFEMDQCKVRPLSYIATTKRPLKEEITQTLTFDWERKKVEYSSKDEQKSFDLDTVLYDPVSFFFEARCELMAGKKQLSYPLIHKGNKKTHNYKVIGTQVVETGQGEFEALVVERERKNKNRQTRFYVAPSLGYLLVKIEHQESRLLKMVATLKDMSYQLVDNLK